MGSAHNVLAKLPQVFAIFCEVLGKRSFTAKRGYQVDGLVVVFQEEQGLFKQFLWLQLVLGILLFDILCYGDGLNSFETIFRVSLLPFKFLCLWAFVPDDALDLVAHWTADTDHNKSALVKIRLTPWRHVVIRLRCQQLGDLVVSVIFLLELFDFIQDSFLLEELGGCINIKEELLAQWLDSEFIARPNNQFV